ncbi:hypothetical protein DER46DRAFT_570411 [Fusarium sp. MPI-SDFR-AT-0072]|nr:hypothetical protein DER46DRAFT_570411 [Fusarium sp. MPI-SDFR-AT-0072]
MASPVMLRYSRDHEMSILKPHLDYIMDHYGSRNEIPLVIITTRFHRLRNRLGGQPASELHSWLSPSDSGRVANTSSNAPLTHKIQACVARNEMRLSRDTGGGEMEVHRELLTCSVRVPHSIRRPFYGKGFRRLETTPNNCRNVRLFEFRPFELFAHLFKKVIEDARSHLCQRQRPQTASQRLSKRQRVNKSPKMGAEQVKGENDSDIRGFIKIKRVERNYFCDKLAIQGNRLKLLLENLNEDARAHYLVKELSKAVLVMQKDKKTYKWDRSSFVAVRKYWY